MTQRLLLVSQLAALCAAPAAVVGAQQRDTTARPADSLRVYTLPPAVVSVTRGNPPINRIPQAVQLVDKTEISRARPTWGLDERSEEHTSELQSPCNIVCRLLLEKKKQ